MFLICAFLLLKAGFNGQASQAGGFAEALSWLDSPTDFVIAVGLFGFGVFSLIEARFRILHGLADGGGVRRAFGQR